MCVVCGERKGGWGMLSSLQTHLLLHDLFFFCLMLKLDVFAINHFVLTNACSNSAPMLIFYPAFHSF